MAIEAKDLLELIGAEQEFETIEDAQKAFHEKWISKALAVKDKDIRSKVAGEVLGATETQVKRLFGLKGEDLKDKKVEELIQLAAETVQKQIDEAKAQSGASDDERVKSLEAEKANLLKERDEYKTLHSTVKQQLDSKESEFAAKIKASTLNEKLGKIKAEIPFAKDLPQVSKLGFETLLEKKYNFDLDDKNEIIATDKEGNRIQNSAKTDYVTAAELIAIEASKENLIAKSNGGNDEKKTEKLNNEQQNNGAPKRQMHPNAVAAVAK